MEKSYNNEDRPNDRWSVYNKMKQKNDSNENKTIAIHDWIDYFKYINDKLNIQISDNMKLDLLKNDIKNIFKKK